MRDMSQEIVEEFWTHELGASAGFVSVSRQVGWAAQERYNGVQLFRRGERLIVAAPSRCAKLISGALDGRSVDQSFSRTWLQTTLGDAVERIDGPADILYADQSSFRGAVSHAARALTDADRGAYHALASVLDGQEIADSGFSADNFPAFGVFSGDRLCAVASYRVRQPSIAEILVATHPNYRRQGFARAALSALALEAFKFHLVLELRAPASNENSLAFARALGFGHYCSTLFAQLRAPR